MLKKHLVAKSVHFYTSSFFCLVLEKWTEIMNFQISQTNIIFKIFFTIFYDFLRTFSYTILPKFLSNFGRELWTRTLEGNSGRELWTAFPALCCQWPLFQIEQGLQKFSWDFSLPISGKASWNSRLLQTQRVVGYPKSKSDLK